MVHSVGVIVCLQIAWVAAERLVQLSIGSLDILFLCVAFR